MAPGRPGQGVDKVPACLIVGQVVAQQSGGFVRVGVASSPGLEMAHGETQGSGVTDEAAMAAPIDDIDVGVDQGDAERRQPAGPGIVG